MNISPGSWCERQQDGPRNSLEMQAGWERKDGVRISSQFLHTFTGTVWGHIGSWCLMFDQSVPFSPIQSLMNFILASLQQHSNDNVYGNRNIMEDVCGVRLRRILFLQQAGFAVCKFLMNFLFSLICAYVYCLSHCMMPDPHTALVFTSIMKYHEWLFIIQVPYLVPWWSLHFAQLKFAGIWVNCLSSTCYFILKFLNESNNYPV